MLKVRIDRLDGVQSKIHVEAPAERVEEEIDAAARKYRKELQIPGFRKGKVPVGLIKSRFREALKNEVLSELVPELYQEAIDQEGFSPLTQAQIEDVDYQTGEPFHFAASVELRPDIKVIGYDDLRVTRPIYRASEEQVEAWIAHLRDRHAQIEMVHRAAREGDVIQVDLQRIDSGGIPIIGDRMEDQLIEIGTGRPFGEAFDRQIAGAEEGEERRVELIGSDEQPILFSVKVKEIHEKTLPELDDEFAKDVGHDTLQDLRDKIRTYIRAQMEEASEHEMRSEIISSLIARNPFDAPETMVENYLRSVIEEVKKRSSGEVDEEAIRQAERGNAIRHIKTHLILQGIGKAEHIEGSDEEVEDQIRKSAEASNTPFEELRDATKENGRWERIRSDLLEKKVMDFLVERADIQEVPMDQKHPGIVIPASLADELKAEREEEIALVEEH